MTTAKEKKTTTRTSRTTAKKADEPKAAPQTAQEAPRPEGPRGRYSPKQRAAILEQAQKMVDDGASWQAAAETLGVRPDNLRRWRQAGAKQSPDLRVRELEAKNKRLRSAVVTMAIELGEATVHGPYGEESETARMRTALATLALENADLKAR